MISIKALRLLVTSRCSYHCIYCHKEGMKKDYAELLDVADYKYFVGVLKSRYGLEKVTLSGGDPCCRQDICQITRGIKDLGIFLVLATKGMDLKGCELVDQINFSIDTLNAGLYAKITGVDSKFLQKAILELKDAKSRGIRICINTVVIRGVNDDKKNFEDLISFCSQNKIDEWKLIEEMNLAKQPCLKDFYLEEYASRMGIKTNRLKKYKLALKYRGQDITLYRCHCAAVWLTKKYISESLFLDPEGNILPCMRKDAKINLFDDIRKRNSNAIIRMLSRTDFQKICPMLNSN